MHQVMGMLPEAEWWVQTCDTKVISYWLVTFHCSFSLQKKREKLRKTLLCESTMITCCIHHANLSISINEVNFVCVWPLLLLMGRKTLELVILHSSFDLLKKYAKTLTFQEVLSYSWGPINQSKSVLIQTVSFIVSSGMLWKIGTNSLRLKHWL